MTIWNYEPRNNHDFGDGWNGEDLSLWSPQDCKKKDPEVDLETLICDGARALPAFCRPFPISVAGHLTRAAFDIKQAEFKIEVMLPGLGDEHPIKQELAEGDRCTTTIYLPFLHFRQVGGAVRSTCGQREQHRVVGLVEESLPKWSNGDGPTVLDLQVELSEGNFTARGQYGYWSYPGSTEKTRSLILTVQRWGGALWTAGGAVDAAGT